MLIKRIDNGDINLLKNNSHKEIIFKCEKCGIEVQQQYRNYLKQKDGHFCRSCRNKNTAQRLDVKEKQSKASQERWLNEEYKKSISEKISLSTKKSWNNNNERKEKLSINNPMKNEEIRKRVSIKKSTLDITIKNKLDELGYEYIEREKNIKGKNFKVHYICVNGHDRWQIWNDIQQGRKCSECSLSSSQAEEEIYEYIKTFNLDIIRKNRTLIKPFELDIIIPSKKIAIEYCGLYWHSELQGKNKKYHLNKLNMCNDLGYRLITIFEDEWLFKKDIVKNRLKHILNNNIEKIYARKCIIKEIDVNIAKDFINTYHIQGYTPSSIKLGAFYNDELVSVMTFAKGNISKGSKNINGVYELSRFCLSKNVIGIASKFLNYFNINYKWEKLYSYADRRWSNGNVYEKIGFNFISFTEPNYWYFKYNDLKRIHRFNFRKDRIKHLSTNYKQTEWEIMQEQKWDRIYDCGNIRYEMKKLYYNK